MNTTCDKVTLTLAEAAIVFGVNIRTLRSWVEVGRLVPASRAGRGRGRRMHFRRGDIAALMLAACPVCGSRFKRGTLKQRFCSTLCHQRFAMIKLGPTASAPVRLAAPQGHATIAHRWSVWDFLFF